MIIEVTDVSTKQRKLLNIYNIESVDDNGDSEYPLITTTTNQTFYTKETYESIKLKIKNTQKEIK